MAANFSVRIVKNEEDFITAWIDKDDSVCIEQPFNPEKAGAAWESEEEAKSWADSHALMLNNQAPAIDPMIAINEKLDAISKALKI
jgi:hypothetical protein